MDDDEDASKSARSAGRNDLRMLARLPLAAEPVTRKELAELVWPE